MDTVKMQKIFEYYFTGKDIYGQLFNYPNLHMGTYGFYIETSDFTFDSDSFNNSLSTFLRGYDSEGNFCIASMDPESYLSVCNKFNPELLNAKIENSNEVLKYVPTYLVDYNFKWSIYMDNDLDAFITWSHKDVTLLFNNFFEKPNDDFHREMDEQVFLETIINRNSYRKGFNFEEYKQAICSKNHYLFKCG